MIEKNLMGFWTQIPLESVIFGRMPKVIKNAYRSKPKLTMQVGMKANFYNQMCVALSVAWL